MILPDTSAWVEYVRGTGSAVHLELRDLLRSGAPLATTGPVLMELIAGTGDEARSRDVRRLLARCAFVPTEDPADFEAAAEIFRKCRASGKTVRGASDCLIAAVAVRAGASVLHRDADFEAIAACTALTTATTTG